MELPATLIDDMKEAALAAGKRAIQVQKTGTKDTKIKADHSVVTIADRECEQIIRDRLEKYITEHGFAFQGEETGLSRGTSDFAFVVDPIDGTTNYVIGDPNWMVSIGVTYKGKPVAGVTYQPEIDKLYSAQEGQGAFLTQFGETSPLKISDGAPSAHVFETLFARHPNRGAQRALHAIIDEWIPALTENAQHARYRSLGCPSVPLCMMAEGARSGLVAKPIKMHDVAASYVIAHEAGAEISLVKENPDDLSHEASYGIVAAARNLFPTLKKIYDDTVGHAPRVYRPAPDADIAAQLAADGVKYGISVGRRQPMHRGHLDCIREMAAAGLKPIIVIGSTNRSEDRYFDPIKNPLTEEQQREQLRQAMDTAGIKDYTILAIKDVGSAEFWTGSLSKLLHDHGISSRESVFHFRSKSSDVEALGNTIVPLSSTQEMMTQYGLSVWESYNKKPSMDELSATPFRTIALDLPQSQKPMRDTLATPDYIRGLASAARADNPDLELLNAVPVTMLDLTLQRLRLERHLTTADILGHTPATSLHDVQAAIAAVLQKPGTNITGQFTAVSGREKGASHGK